MKICKKLIGCLMSLFIVFSMMGPVQAATMESQRNDVSVSKISFNYISKTLYTNEHLQLKATLTPSNATNSAITWSSSNTKVASVNSTGLVYTKAPGTATITAMTSNGITKTCKITVLKRGLTTTSASLYVKGTTKLTFKGSYGTVTWSSDKKSVATVDKYGKVTAVRPGTAYITAKSKTAISRCKITVKQPALNKHSASLYLGSHMTLKVTGGTGAITWTSSNKSIATVNSKGYVTTKKAGTVYIKAKRNGYTAQCKLTVKKPSVNATSKSIYTGFYTTLKVNGGTGKITWSSSNKNIATVNSSGRVVGKKAGTAYIYAKRNGYTTKCKVSVKENAKSYNVSTNVFDYDRGEPSVAVRKVYYSGGALRLDTYVVNNRMTTVKNFKKINFKIYDYTGKLIANQTFTNFALNINPYSYKKITFKFSSAGTLKKGALLYKGITGYYEGSYTYTY